MLFPYQYLPHAMDTMQGYIQFILEDVWCNATNGMAYDIDALFAANQGLCDMITELHTQDLKGANVFLTSLQTLFEKFKTLNAAQKQQFKDWSTLNNDIQQLCEHGDQCSPATYSVIAGVFSEGQYPGLVTELGRFYKNLYSADFLKLASVQSRIGTVGDHNNKFTTLNDRDVCPFCGLAGILGQYHSKREAYDHYFPKDKYPFNSINFHNLVPACHHCNSSYKLAKNPHYDSKNPLGSPRRVFYPFSKHMPAIDVSVSLNHPDWENLTANDVEVAFGPDALGSELGTWCEVYEIEERYKAECCSKNSGKAWLADIFDLAKRKGRAPQEYLDDLEQAAGLDPYVDKRFIKMAFLQGCQKAGLF